MPAMIDHTGFLVADAAASIAFFQQALAPLGYALLMHRPAVAGRNPVFAGFGVDGKPDLWLVEGAPTDRVHIAFRAKGRADVRAFYDAAIAAGGTDNGPPGVREMYHPNYYAAFVRDLDGHNIEVVCHEPYLD